jgi:hypothetical protein
LLECLTDRLPAQIADTPLQQVAEEELLQIGSGQREPIRRNSFGQPLGYKDCIIGVRE